MVPTYWSSPWRPPPWPVPLLVLTSCFLSESITPFPKDLEPISVVASEQSYQFPGFQGLLQDNDTVRLGLDFQRLLRINHMLYIAARDHVFAVNLTTAAEDFVPRLKLTWRSKDVGKCTVRGKNSDECYNYVKVLVPRNDETLFACGTNAFNPTCRNYKMSSLQHVGDEVGGQARCPFESGQSNVGLFAGGDFYSATMTDFLASDAVLYRSLGAGSVLRTVKYDSKWLREPHFLHAIDYGNYVYFFLSEIAVEYTALGKVVFSRVARVCKNDDGGSPRVLERHWTSFLKARLNCSLPGDSFFYFDVLQSLSGVLQVNRRPAVVGVFTTQANSIPGSAVCAFYLDDIEKAFGGRFKAQRGADAAWTPVPEEQVPRPRPGSCAGDGPAADFRSSVQFPDETLAFIKAHPLMEEAVPSVNQRPCFTRTSSRSKLTQIAVDAAAGPFKDRTVVFLGSDEGRVLKVLAGTQPEDVSGSRLLEDIDVYNPSRCDVQGQEDRRVLGLELDKDHQALFVAFSSCVIRVPLARCHRHGTCRGACLASRDPYCIWLRTGSCANMAPGIKAGFDQDIEGDPAPAPPPPDGCHDDVLTTTRNQESAADSAYGVRRPLEAERLPYTLLLACVLLAFLLGAALSGLLVSCCCGARRLGRDEEEAHAMSLRTLAKLQQEEDKLGVSTLRMYSSFIPNGRAAPLLPPLSLSQADGELSGLPTPASSPEPAGRNTPALNASSSSLHLPEEALHEGRGGGGGGGAGGGGGGGGGGAAGAAPPPSALEELLLHMQEVSASGTGGIKVLTCTSSMFHGPSAGGGRPPHYHRGPQQHLPETSSPPYCSTSSSSSSSTPLQVIPETRLLPQRHSLIKMGAVPRHHSFNHQGALARMNTNSSSNGPAPSPPPAPPPGGPAPPGPSACLTRQHSYSEAPRGQRAPVVRRTASLKPQAPPTARLLPHVGKYH